MFDKYELEKMVEGSGGGKKPAATGPVIPPFCIKCGYRLTGCTSPNCPECGEPFVAKLWRARAAEIVQNAADRKDANDWAKRGVYLAIAGVVFESVHLSLGGTVCAGALCALLALVCGVSAAFLGLSVFRVSRPPAWAAEFHDRPAYGLAISGLLLGGLIIVAAALR